MSYVLKFMAAAFVIAAVSLAEAMPLGLRTAMWNISKANRQKKTFLETDVTVVGFTGKYDGAAHGIGVMVKEGIEDVIVRYAAGDSVPALPWSETSPTITDVGSMTVWCEIAAPGYITQTNSATVVISPREVTLTSGSASKVYDGTALVSGNVTVGGDGFVDGEGASYNVTGSQTNVGESENAFTYTLSNNTKASNYNITTVNGTLTVTKANVGGGAGGDEEPGDGEVPQGGVSKFDASFVYDGEGHTISTNALVVAFGSAMVGASAIEYAIDADAGGGRVMPALPWLATAPVYTNAGEYIVWYRVTNPNYNEFTYAAKVTITPRTGVVVDIFGNVATNMYSGAAQSVDGYTVAINDLLYKETDFEFAGNSAISGTTAGKYPMGLIASQFSNKNENFADVTFNVIDGELVILEPAQKSVILDALGGRFADGSVVTQECEDVYLTFPVATREGYVFDGWYTGKNGTGIRVTADTILTADMTSLYAHWTQIMHTVTVDGVATNVAYGTELMFTAPESFFDDTCTTQLVYVGTSFYQPTTNEFSIVVTNNIEFTWDILATNYWLNINKPLHGAITGATNGWYAANTAVDLSAVEDTGYSFNEWTGDVSGCTELGVVLSVPMNKPRSIGASFVAESYTITYAGTKDTENTNPTSYTIEDEIAFAPLSDIEGWKFTGWQPASISRGSTGAVTVTAQWSEIKPELGKGDYRVAGDELDGTVPEKASSVYDGYIYLDNVVMGTIQAKVSKPKLNKKLGVTTAKTSVAIQVTGEKKITLKGELDLNIGEFTVTDKKSDRELNLKLGLDGITGTFGKYDIDGARNFFDSKDKSEKSTAEEILKPYLGAYSMICDGGILSVTIAKKGKVTIKGSIDGNKVSLKAQALIGEDMICIPVIYSKKSVNLAFTIWLPINGGDAVIIGLDDAIIGKAGTLKNGAKFIIDGDIGDYIETEDERTLELLPNGEIVTVSGSKWLVADGIKPAKVAYKKGEFTITEGRKGAGIANPSGLKLTYKSKDGSFKGSFTAYGIVNGKLKKHKASVEGVLVNGVGYGTITIKRIGTWAVTIK